VIQWAEERGMMFYLFGSWRSLIYSALLWSEGESAAFVAIAHQRIHARLIEIEASAEAISRWVKGLENE
jgi:hypothetical protein